VRRFTPGNSSRLLTLLLRGGKQGPGLSHVEAAGS